jgi:hypothetical protein
MSTKFPEPKFEKWQTVDGWVFPDVSGDNNFNEDPLKSFRHENELFAPINSFEFQQGIFGQYRLFYGIKNRNNLTKACFQMCVNKNTLKTSNLTQEDKVCARECLLSSEKLVEATKYFLEKKQAENSLNNEFILLDNLKYFQ